MEMGTTVHGHPVYVESYEGTIEELERVCSAANGWHKFINKNGRSLVWLHPVSQKIAELDHGVLWVMECASRQTFLQEAKELVHLFPRNF